MKIYYKHVPDFNMVLNWITRL